MAEFNANIVVQPYEITVNVDQPGITVTPDVTDLNIYAVGGTNGVPAGNVGDIQYYAANGFAAIPSNVANYTGGNFKLNVSNTKITGGTNGYVLQTDGAGNVAWVAPSGSGNGVVGGANTQIQFNDGGLFGGNAGFTFDKSTGNVNVPANLIVGGSVIGNVPNANFATYSAVAANADFSTDGALANLANVATIAGTVYTNAQPNITSVGNLTDLTVVSNIYAGSIYTLGPSGNIYGANVITANTLIATDQVNANTANINTLNITNTVTTNANIATANINTATVTNLVATTANVTTFTANGVVTLGSNANVRISGGANGQYLTTNGASGLSWTSVSNLTNGTSSVAIPSANGNININVGGGTAEMIVSANAVAVNGTLNVSSNLNVSGTINGNISGSIANANYANTAGIANALQNNVSVTLTTATASQIVPFASGSGTIGFTGQRWANIFVNNVFANAGPAGNIYVNNLQFGEPLRTSVVANAAVSTTVTHKIPIIINGVTYYMMLTDTP